MKKYTSFDLGKFVTDLEGHKIPLQLTQNTFIDLTVRNAFRRALGNVFADEQQNITLDQKTFRNDIAEKYGGRSYQLN